MKRFFSGSLLVAVLILSGFTAIMGTTYNQTVNISEGETTVTYYGTVDMTGDAEGTWYTRDMYIGDMNASAAYLRAVASDVTGTEDVNVGVEFSNDRVTWDAVSSDVIDALSTTAVYDTLTTVQGTAIAEFKANRWMRLKFVGQSSNPETTLSWHAQLTKNTGAAKTDVARTETRITS